MVRANDTMTPQQQDRSSFLAMLLGIVMALSFMAFFYFVAPTFFLIMVMTVGGLTVYGGLHYLLWGKTFMKETAKERAELLEQDRKAAEQVEASLPHQRRY